jgi:uncharacterized membrane protein
MSWSDLAKLVGVLIVILGFALRLRTTLVVVVAALVTGLVAGLPLFSNEGPFAGIPFVTRPDQEGIINMLGRAFTENRFITLFIITLPAIGLAERFGLQEQAAVLIRRIKAATVGRLQIVYQLFRIGNGALGLRLNGHAAFVRPLIFPMSLGAAEAMTGAASEDDVPDEIVERVKASNAAGENYGNFYGQNLSPVQAGILLVLTTMNGLGYAVSVWSLVYYTLPIVGISVALAGIQFLRLDKQILRKAATSADD